MGAPFTLRQRRPAPAVTRTFRPDAALTITATAIIFLALVLRVYAIGRLPGWNADEAWYGVAALDLIDGGRFSLVTPNGNMLGPLQFGELALLHLFFEPSVTLLRIPALLSSVGAIALAYLAGKRIGGGATAWLAALIMAVLPINIAYARLGWDPSHSGFVILLSAWLLLGGRHYCSAAIFAGSLLVHPTNMFAAPFLLMVRAGQAFEQQGEARGKAIRHYAIMMLAAVAGYYAIRTHSNAAADPGKIMARLIDPAQYVEFARRLGDMLTGDTSYMYLAGQGLGSLAAPLAWLFIGTLALLLIRRLNLRGFDVRQGVLLGWLASLAAFFALTGPIALYPHFERYGLVLIAPTALAAAVMLAPYAERRWFPALAGGAGASALAGFMLCFIVPLSNGTYETHRSIITGPVEPKAAAAEQIGRFAAGKPIEVVAEDFWLYLPANYLLRGQPVRLRSGKDEPALDPHGAPHAYWLVWRDREAERRLRSAGTHRLVWVSGDQRGKVRIWQPK